MIFPFEEGFDPIDYSLVKTIPMNYCSGILGCGQSNIGFFRKELLDMKVTSTFLAIELGLRTATSRSQKFKRGDYVIFESFKYDYKLLCLVIKSSYLVSDISNVEWSNMEGWDLNYQKDNPDVLKKYQFQFRFIRII